MANCDTWMNIHMREVICTSKDGDRFWRLPEAYLRGNTIKYLRLPEESLQKAREQSLRRDDRRQFSGGRGGGRGGPGGGRGPPGGGGRGGQYSGGRGDGGGGGRGRGPPPSSAGRGS